MSSVISSLKSVIGLLPDFIPSENFEIIVMIDGEQYNYWTEAVITKRFDGISTFSITSPFDPTIKEFRELFRPGVAHEVIIYVDGAKIITGDFVNIKPGKTATAYTVTMDGYAKCGVFSTANPDPASWPVYMDGLTLDQIINTLGAPFGITGDTKAGDVNAYEAIVTPFTGVNAVTPKPDQKIWDFLTKLSKQRGVYLSDDINGNIEIKSYNYLEISTRIDDTISNIDVNYNFNNIPSNVFGVGTDLDSSGKKTGIVNPAITGTYKPVIYKASDTGSGGLKKSAIGELGRKMVNAINVSIDYPGWKTPDGVLLRAGDVVAVKSPGNMIYDWYDFIVRNITYKKTGTAQTTKLDCTFWQAFNGEILAEFPWAEPSYIKTVSGLIDDITRAVPSL